MKKINQVSIRLVSERPLLSEEQLTSPEKVAMVVGDYIRDLDREALCVINFNSKLQPIFTIESRKFFAFGGASSHDISDGVLEIDDPRVKEWRDDPDKMYRINHISWWEREMPNQEEMDEGIKNLAEHNNKVDFILTHCTASSTAALLSHGLYKPDKLTNYLEEIRRNVDYKRWLCGHYHDNKAITIKDIVIYEQIVRIA